MAVLTCINCGELFESSDKIDKCSECVLHGQLFDDILNDVVSDVARGPVYGVPNVTHLTPEEAGINAIRTWKEDYEDLLKALHLRDVEHYRDFQLLIIAMGWKRIRVSPWHAILIVTHLYIKNSKLCYTGNEFHNPFRLLKMAHPGILKYATKLETTFGDLVEEAEKFLKNETN